MEAFAEQIDGLTERYRGAGLALGVPGDLDEVPAGCVFAQELGDAGCGADEMFMSMSRTSWPSSAVQAGWVVPG